MGSSSLPIVRRDCPVIYITGFSKFWYYSENTSEMAVDKLKELKLEEKLGCQIVFDILNVSYEETSSIIPKKWKELNPKLVIHIGMKFDIDKLILEQVAHNCGYEYNDDHKKVPKDMLCILGGEEEIKSGICMETVSQTINKNGTMKSEKSTNAGRCSRGARHLPAAAATTSASRDTPQPGARYSRKKNKSQDEPMFAPIYARLCRDLAASAGIQQDLTAACEAHFMENYQQMLQYNVIFEGSITSQLIHEEILARKRFIGHIKFISELHKVGVVSGNQVAAMAETLIQHGDDRSLEGLCRLLSFSGLALSRSHEELVNQSCAYLENCLENGTLNPRLRFLTQDTLDLHANGWRPQGGDRIHPPLGRNVRG